MNKVFFDVFPNIQTDEKSKELLSKTEVTQIRYSEDKKFLLVFLVFPRLVDESFIQNLEALINRQVLKDLKIQTRIQEQYALSEEYTLSAILDEYKERLIRLFLKRSRIAGRILQKAAWNVVSENEICLKKSFFKVELDRLETLNQELSFIFKQRFSKNVKFSFEQEASENAHIFTHSMDEMVAPLVEKKEALSMENQAAAEKTSAPVKKQPSKSESKEMPKEADAKKAKPKKAEHVIYGRDFNDDSRSLGDFDAMEEGPAVVTGDIMSVEVRELRDKVRSIVSFSITDYTDSIFVVLFMKNEEVPEIIGEIQPGKTIKIKGVIQFDSFRKESVIRSVFGILKSDVVLKEMRSDNAPVKRVELHCHTKSSENDGVTDVGELMKTAESWGHSALAITDHGSVYAFPDVIKKKKGDALKIIYGVEGYLVDDTKEIVVNPGNHLLTDETVVFDIETTGFSPEKNTIIEIGAVKIKNNEIIDRFSTFVNPKGPIPYRIWELTGISNEQVADAPTLEEVLPKFLAFIEGAVLVAHNAEFDISFIQQKLKECDLLPEQPFSYVDTLGLSRILLKNLGNYRLDHVAKELKVSLENHHRAVDDAECTALIYQKLVTKLMDKKLYTLKDVYENVRPDKDSIKKMMSYHVIILAKNETGRVNLYRLVSESALNYFYRRPKIPKSLLEKYREGLIIGSACVMGELFSNILDGKPEDELARIINFYDYLEVQPLGNNAFLLGSQKHEDITTEQDLIDLNRRIIELGDKYNKPVVATGDVHFLNPEDGIYREILQFATMKGDDGEDQAPLYFRTTEEMLQEFSYLGHEKAYEIVVENTNKIADSIEKISPVRPDTCPPIIENSDVDLRESCYKKAHEIYGENLPEIVENRLEKELNSIISHGYAVMYIIAQKLVLKSISDGYLVGSRGSVGSSFAATMAGITEVNPLPPHYVCPNCKYSDFDSEEVKKHHSGAGVDMPDALCPKCGTPLVKSGFNIPFETFLGFKGDKEPDIDLNFSGEYQAKAHAYTEIIFGKGQTFRAGTVGTVAEKTAIGYTLKYMESNGIQKRFCEIQRIAKGIEGVRRTTGQHPGGIVVLPLGENIYSFTPIQHPANDQKTSIITTSFEYHSIQHNLLKLDILGHDDPSMIRMIQDLTQKDPTEFPLDSPEVMSLFQSTKALNVTPEDLRGCPLGALGIPEFGTDNAMNMLRTAKPTCFSDLVRISGLAHGTDVWANNAETLISEGTATIQTVICCRDDIMEYLIGKGLEPSLSFTIMESVRKGKGLKPEWEEEMLAHDVPDWYIGSCKKIKYMFPKAHAAAYVMMAWRIAYCKIFYPLAYYASFFSIRASAFSYEIMCVGQEHLEKVMDDYQARMDSLSDKEKEQYKNMKIVQEMYARGFSFVPIDIYQSTATRFKIVDEKHLMPSFLSIDGLGDKAADLMELGGKKGPYLSIKDFRQRTKLNQTLVDKMVSLNLLKDLPADNQFSLFDV